MSELISISTIKWLLIYGWKPFVEIGVIAFIIYCIAKFVRGTGAAHVLKGLIVVVVIFIISQKLELYSINWLLTKVFAFSVIAFLIIFQPELRKALAQLGRNRLFGRILIDENKRDFIAEISKAVGILSRKKVGALIVLEREVGLRNYIESGISINSLVSAELLVTIFMPTTPLHDGAIIIQRENLAAAGCLLPLIKDSDVSKSFGTRHRAAMGITDETDSIAVVVSEKSGIISLVIGGKITRDLDSDTLRKVLKKTIFKEETQKNEN